MLGHRDSAWRWCSVLDLEWEIELNGFGACGYRVGDFGNEAASASDVKGPEVHVGRDEPVDGE